MRTAAEEHFYNIAGEKILKCSDIKRTAAENVLNTASIEFLEMQ